MSVHGQAPLAKKEILAVVLGEEGKSEEGQFWRRSEDENEDGDGMRRRGMTCRALDDNSALTFILEQRLPWFASQRRNPSQDRPGFQEAKLEIRQESLTGLEGDRSWEP